jgi:hypothetical protein
MKLRNLIIIAGAFLFISLAFNYTLWKDLFTYNPQEIILNDSIPNEFLTETSYQNILKLKNPFVTDKILYPFEINFSFNDPIITNVIFLFFLRPFLSIHQSSLAIVLINIFLANILMFTLLKKLKINTKAAFISACVFGFTPFISQRIVSGHYTYTTIYLFPLLFLSIYSFLISKTLRKKITYSFFTGLVFALSILTNIFYFLSQILALFFFIVYELIKDWKRIKNLIIENYKYFTISIFAFIIIILPWLIQVKSTYSTQSPIKTNSFYGAIDLSADLVSFITPNEFNPFYSNLVIGLKNTHLLLTKFSNFFFNNRLSFAYPGVLIILSFLFLVFFRKNIHKKIKKHIDPFLFTSLFFMTLSLGPFLKFFRRWYIPLEENIPVVIPLPFLLLHYLPGFETIRAPMRFIPIFVFFSTIVLAYILNFIFKKFTNKINFILFIAVFLLFFLDQFYLIPNETYKKIPNKAYMYIKSDSIKSTVLEIPFTVRDGLQYMGFVYGTSPMTGALIHNKPIIGGYISRISPEIFNFYRNKSFINYIASIIDKGNYNPLKEKPNEPNIFPYKSSLVETDTELRELNIRYILLKNDEKYSIPIKDIISKINFKKIMTDVNYDLYLR